MYPVNERKDHSSVVFGLPEDQKYPLTTVEHIREAVGFFYKCPASKKNQLANAINKRANELQVKIDVHPKSAFAKYAGRSTVVNESHVPTPTIQADDMHERKMEEIQSITRDIENATKTTISVLMNQMAASDTLDTLITYERELTDMISRRMNVRELGFNPLVKLNRAVDYHRNKVFEFLAYNQNQSLYSTRIVNALVDDIICQMRCNIQQQDADGLYRTCEIMDDLIKTIPQVNRLMITRKLVEMLHDVNLTCADHPDFVRMRKIIMGRLADLDDYQNPGLPILHPDNDDWMLIMGRIDRPDCVTATIKQNYTPTNSLLSDYDFNPHQPMNVNRIQNVTGFLSENDTISPAVRDVLGQLCGKVNLTKVGLYDPTLSFSLSTIKKFEFIRASNKFEHIVADETLGGTVYFFGVSCDSLYLLATRGEDLVIITLVSKDHVVAHLENFCGNRGTFDYSKSLPCTTMDRQNNHVIPLSKLTEGLTVDAQGNLKFVFQPKRSLMDEYSENHKVLMANVKAENWDAAKVNLAYHFTIINYVERKYMHAVKKSGAKYDDAMKARMFATNDFKTYMQQLLMQEPGFNFATFYEEGEYGKTIMHMTTDNIKGIRTLVQMIMMR